MGADIVHRVILPIDVVDTDEITFQLRANAVAGTSPHLSWLLLRIERLPDFVVLLEFVKP